MLIFRWIAQGLIFGQRLWRRLKIILLRPAFRRYGRNFLFDPNSFYSYQNIEVGDDVSIGSGAAFMASESKIIIGNKVMFGPNVIVVSGNHNTSVVGKFMYDVHEKRLEDDQDVIFEDDIWIGSGAIILKGVKVGRGSIIAAGALVNRNVLPYTIVAGVPAKVLSSRFDDINKTRIHDEALYPCGKRLKEEELSQIFNMASHTKE
jgi:acetyltransferase-like isoleucine patch superfamily enzyme